MQLGRNQVQSLLDLQTENHVKNCILSPLRCGKVRQSIAINNQAYTQHFVSALSLEYEYISTRTNKFDALTAIFMAVAYLGSSSGKGGGAEDHAFACLVIPQAIWLFTTVYLSLMGIRCSNLKKGT